MSKRHHVAAAVADIPPGDRKQVTIAGRTIAIFNIGGEYFAIGDTCPHESGSLCKGKIVGLAESPQPGEYRLTRPGEFIKCPWHGWEFDIRTGQSYCDPSSVRVRRFDANIASGSDVIKGPYVADTFTVRVEDDYVIVEL